MNIEEWLAKLIAFDTTSNKSNLSLIEFLGNWLEGRKIPVNLTYDSTGTKANLFATLPGRDKALGGGLLLSGHTDVVPVDDQIWETDPFCAFKINDRIYGRGACDMKGFLAVVLSLIPKFQSTSLSYPLHFAFSYDEEIGCLGAPSLIADFQQKGIQPAACIVGEPTEMIPVVAHKGIHNFRCKVRGSAAHSSLTPKGCNAIEYAAKMICWLKSLADELKYGPQDPFYDVPFTTLTTTMISGGIAMNTIPETAEFLFSFRNLPSENPDRLFSKIEGYAVEHLLPEMLQESKDALIEIELLNRVPDFEASEDAPLTQAARKVTQERKIQKVSYATEAGLFQKAGVPTLLCGPGSIEQAHKPNEFVSLDQLNKCEDFLVRMVKYLF